MTIIKKFEPVEQKSKFPKKYMALAVLSILALTVMEIWASNMVVTYGEKYEKLSSIQQALNLENQILGNEIAKQASLISVASKSAALGFYKLESIQYIR